MLLVDGHSVIFAWPELRTLHGSRSASARDRLVETMVGYGDTMGTHVVIVFDGRGEKASADPAENRVQVFYSKSGQTADSVIERLVAKYAGSHAITVVTDDNMERSTVSAFGARWISSQELTVDVRMAKDQLRIRLAELKKRNR